MSELPQTPKPEIASTRAVPPEELNQTAAENVAMPDVNPYTPENEKTPNRLSVVIKKVGSLALKLVEAEQFDEVDPDTTNVAVPPNGVTYSSTEPSLKEAYKIGFSKAARSIGRLAMKLVEAEPYDEDELATSDTTTPETSQSSEKDSRRERAESKRIARANKRHRKFINNHFNPRSSISNLAHMDEVYDIRDGEQYDVQRDETGKRIGPAPETYRGSRGKIAVYRRTRALAHENNEALPEDERLSYSAANRQARAEYGKFLRARFMPERAAKKQKDHGTMINLTNTVIREQRREAEKIRLENLSSSGATRTTRRHELTSPRTKAEAELKKGPDTVITEPKGLLFRRSRRANAANKRVILSNEAQLRIDAAHLNTPAPKYSSPELDAAKARGDNAEVRRILRQMVEANGGRTKRSILLEKGIDLDESDRQKQEILDNQARERAARIERARLRLEKDEREKTKPRTTRTTRKKKPGTR